MTRTLRLAVPNKGRLEQPTATLLRDAGLVFEKTERALSVVVHNVDLELLFVRADDIPEMVADGVAELGITGQDLLAEHGNGLPVLAELGYGRCRLVAAVPRAVEADKAEDFAGFRVATSHPRVTADFFAGRGIDVTIVPLKGSVEVAPKLDVADAVVDLVSTGSTLMVNGLQPVGTILESQAVLAANPTAIRERSTEVEQVVTALSAVVAGRGKRYLLLNAPAGAVDKMAEIIPGMESPTVVPLAEEGWVAVHSVVDADDVWNVLPDLKALGGRDILVLRIQQLIA
ncbi:MAG: ATP phosphoribosyltransferase [Acidimicrobiia bacterium]|nr:ATP phosphoribosyltransferase [Acidimicrobiia bacterium]